MGKWFNGVLCGIIDASNCKHRGKTQVVGEANCFNLSAFVKEGGILQRLITEMLTLFIV